MSKCTVQSSRKWRRAHWEPFRIKVLRHKIRTCSDDQQRDTLIKQLYAARKQVSRERDAQLVRADLKKGRGPSRKPTALHPIHRLEDAGHITCDPVSIAGIVKEEFETKRWGSSGDTSVEADIFKCEFPPECFEDISLDDIRYAVQSVKRPWLMDRRGIASAALLGSANLLQALRRPLIDLLRSDEHWGELREEGYVKLKERNSLTVAKTRALVPQSIALRVCSILVKKKITDAIDDYSKRLGLRFRVLGGGKGGQVLDVVTPMQQCLELGRDDNDRAAVGHCDIKNFHDSITREAMLNSLLARNIELPLAVAAIRLQRQPRIALRVKGVLTDVISRQRGAVTGNLLAALFGRMVVEDSMVEAHDRLRPHVFKFGDLEAWPMAWSDNLVAFSKSSNGVAKILAILSQALWKLSALRIKDGSSEVVPASTRRHHWPDVVCDGLYCKVVSSTKCLGYDVACNGDTSRLRVKTVAMLRGRLRKDGSVLRQHRVPSFLLARWWKYQFIGLVGWMASFAVPSKEVVAGLEIVANGGARLVKNLAGHCRDGVRLKQIRSNFSIDVPIEYFKMLVSRLAHVFRNKESLVFKLLSLPLQSRLAHLRLVGPDSNNASLDLTLGKLNNWKVLQCL